MLLQFKGKKARTSGRQDIKGQKALKNVDCIGKLITKACKWREANNVQSVCKADKGQTRQGRHAKGRGTQGTETRKVLKEPKVHEPRRY